MSVVIPTESSNATGCQNAPVLVDGYGQLAATYAAMGQYQLAFTTQERVQAGRDSPNGLTTPWKPCTRPSVLTKVPAVSLNARPTCAPPARARAVASSIAPENLAVNSLAFSVSRA